MTRGCSALFRTNKPQRPNRTITDGEAVAAAFGVVASPANMPPWYPLNRLRGLGMERKLGLLITEDELHVRPGLPASSAMNVDMWAKAGGLHAPDKQDS
mmetsp:Transcript_48119/g.148719  ORF Transcript_48119/g.148719 Transcript_48119/m.148719 type:complete len:99 (+) Transcript_48119:452-748(+)